MQEPKRRRVKETYVQLIQVYYQYWPLTIKVRERKEREANGEFLLDSTDTLGRYPANAAVPISTLTQACLVCFAEKPLHAFPENDGRVCYHCQYKDRPRLPTNATSTAPTVTDEGARNDNTDEFDGSRYRPTVHHGTPPASNTRRACQLQQVHEQRHRRDHHTRTPNEPYEDNDNLFRTQPSLPDCRDLRINRGPDHPERRTEFSALVDTSSVNTDGESPIGRDINEHAVHDAAHTVTANGPNPGTKEGVEGKRGRGRPKGSKNKTRKGRGGSDATRRPQKPIVANNDSNDPVRHDKRKKTTEDTDAPEPTHTAPVVCRGLISSLRSSYLLQHSNTAQKAPQKTRKKPGTLTEPGRPKSKRGGVRRDLYSVDNI